jgi:hypothetical protein
MWVALFLICSVSFPCEHVVEDKRTYHETKEQCEQHAIALSVYMTQRIKEIGYDVDIRYRCDIDKEVKRING